MVGSNIFGRVYSKLLALLDPYVVVIGSAFFGFLGWGLKGLLLGGAAAMVAAFVLGTVFTAFSGGLLPRDMRQKTAASFISNHTSLVSAAFPDISPRQYQKIVEQFLEKIVVRATTDNKSMDLLAGLNYSSISCAATAIISEEEKRETRALLEALESHIHREWYSQ